MASPQARAHQLAALPSLSCALSSLPQQRNMDAVALHQASFSNRSAESEAKLRKALNINSQNAGMSIALPKAPAQQSPVGHCPSPPPLMMRSHKSSKIRI